MSKTTKACAGSQTLATTRSSCGVCGGSPGTYVLGGSVRVVRHLPAAKVPTAPSLFDQPETDTAPGRARRDDHASSKAGAASVAMRAGTQKHRLLTAYAAAGHEGLTDDAAAIAVGLDRSCFWKRCGELRDVGAIETTGELRARADRRR